MTIGGIKAGATYVTVGVKNQMKKGLKRAKAMMKGFASGASKIALAGAAGFAAFGASVLALGKKFAASGDALDKMSARVGVSVETLSAWKFAAQQAGATAEQVEKGLMGLSRFMLTAEMGSKKAAEALDLIGLNLSDLQGLSPEEQFRKVAAAISQIEDASMRGAVAQMIFGRAGRQLIPMMESLASAEERAAELGIVMTEEMATSAAKLTDAFGEFSSVMGMVFDKLGATVAETLTTVLTAIAEFSADAVNWFEETFDDVFLLLSAGHWLEGLELGMLQLRASLLEGLSNLLGGWYDFFNGLYKGAVMGVNDVRNVFFQMIEAVVDAFLGLGEMIADIFGLDGMKKWTQNARKFVAQLSDDIQEANDRQAQGVANLFDVDEAQKDVQEAERRMKDKITAAAEAKAAEAEEAAPTTTPEAVTDVKKSMTTSGSFAAISSGFAGQSVFQKNTDANIRTAENTEAIARKDNALALS